MAKQSGPLPVPVLLTRSAAQSRAFAALLADRYGPGVLPVIAPLLEVQPVPPELPPGAFAGVIFTSANAAAAAGALRDRLPDLAWCVGDQTARAARAAGFRAVSAGGDAGALVARIRADPPDGRLLHLRGEETRGEVAEQLDSAGIETVSRVIYRQAALPLPAEGRAVLQTGGPVLVPVFSPASARRLADVLPSPSRAELHLVVISAAVADAVSPIPRASLWQAVRPDAGAMVDAVGKALSGLSPP